MNRKRLQFLLTLLLMMASSAVSAQSLPFYNMYGPTMARDLDLPTGAQAASTLRGRMGVHKPEGAGPFPALVLLHTCGGLQEHVTVAAQDALRRGYVVFVLDSFSQRGVDMVCLGPKGDVFFSRGLRDALMAAENLRKLPFVDRTRVAMVGFSWGGGVGLLASSTAARRAAGWFDPFDAVVSFYPPCHAYPKGRPPYSLVSSDLTVPLLVLLGGKDNETPPHECISGFEPAQRSGAPVQWHLYSDATHCWDCQSLNGFRKVDIRGTTVEYRYDAGVTQDSLDRMFGFYDKVFATRR